VKKLVLYLCSQQREKDRVNEVQMENISGSPAKLIARGLAFLICDSRKSAKVQIQLRSKHAFCVVLQGNFGKPNT